MSNSDRNDTENSPIPTSISPIGSPITAPASNTPKVKNLQYVFHSTGEVGDENDRNDDVLRNSPLPTSISPIGSPNAASFSNSPNSEIQGSFSRSTGDEKKRRRIGDEAERNNDELECSSIPIPVSPIGSPNIAPISSSPKMEIRCSVSLPTEETKKRPRLGAEIDQNDGGFTTPTDLDHRIPKLTQCPPAPRKPSSRKRKSSAETVMETHRNILPVDVSDEETEALLPPGADSHMA